MTPETGITDFHMPWLSVVTGLLGSVFGGALVAWIRQRPKMLEIEKSRDASLIDTLSARVATLETKLDEERNRHEAEVSLLRHRANNSDQCIDALLLLLENADDLPDRVKRAIQSVKDMRDSQRQAQALEKGAMHGAKVAAAQQGVV